MMDSGRRHSLPDQHFALLPGIHHMRLAHSVYGMIRAVNAVTGSALHEGSDWLKRMK
jgi:hypothetical protein